jgi:hypothetical protein
MLRRGVFGCRDRRHRLHALALTGQHKPQKIVMQRTRAIRVTNHAHKSLDIAREPRFNVLSSASPMLEAFGKGLSSTDEVVIEAIDASPPHKQGGSSLAAQYTLTGRAT